MTMDEDLRGEAYTSAVSHIDRLSQSVVAHARDLREGDSILPHSHGKAQFIYASDGIMTVTAVLPHSSSRPNSPFGCPQE